MPRGVPVARSRPHPYCKLLAMFAVAWATVPAVGQLTGSGLTALRERGEREGWTFTVGENGATARSLSQLCGTKPPSNWAAGARVADPPVLRGLPAAFDWRDYNGCTPVKDQLDCGSCWAFATVGPLECNILIKDHITFDLSEQWLVSCNTHGYSCDGGWFVHDHHMAAPVFCGESGAVLESTFPYVAQDAACNCPYARAYTIDNWAYIGTSDAIPATNAMKQAIYDYGPVSVALYVDDAFQGYTGGVFNACADGEVNHAVVLVGWDDTQGPGGVWILRNSWGTGWGEAGYMRIAYGCARVGYGACYVEYGQSARVAVSPPTLDFGALPAGQAAVAELTVTNQGSAPLEGSVSGFAGPFSIDGSASYALTGGESTTVRVRFAPGLLGTSAVTLTFSGGGTVAVPVSGSGVGSGLPADRCAYGPVVGDGTHYASNATADTEVIAPCGGGAADVWWTFAPPYIGHATFDTSGSAIDTVLSVHEACGGSALACSTSVGSVADPPTARVLLDVRPTKTYRVRVAGYAGQTGSIVLKIATTHPSPVITGRIADPNGTGLASVTLAGLPGNPVTNAGGYYSATVAFGFSGTVTPLRTGWVFNPPDRSYVHLEGDCSGNDYLGRRATFTISGRVTDEHGMSLAGVVLNGFAGRVVTDIGGNYAASVDYGFSGNVAPLAVGYAFTPTGRAYRNVLASRTADDYAGRRFVGALQVTLAPAAAVAAGASWRVDGGPWNASGTVCSELASGLHVIEYSPLSDWVSLPTETVDVGADATMFIARTYAPVGNVLTLTVVPPEAGTISVSPSPGGNGAYIAGTVVTLTPQPAEGYHLRMWSGTDSEVTAAVGTVTMTADRAVVAEFDRVLVAGAQEQGATNNESAPTAWGGLCGAGSVGIVPATLLSLLGLKLRSRTSQG